MNDDKFFSWIKLRTNFMQGKEVKYICRIEPEKCHGYIVIMLEILLKYMNSHGELLEYIGDLKVPFSSESFAQEYAWLNITTIDVQETVDVFTKMGFFKTNEEGNIYICNFNDFVGTDAKDGGMSATYKANTKSRETRRKKLEELGVDIVDFSVDLVEKIGGISTNYSTDVPPNIGGTFHLSFLNFWNLYPESKRKEDHFIPTQIEFLYQIYIEKISSETIISGLQMYVDSLKANKTDKRYILYPESFLQKKKYEEYIQNNKNVVPINQQKKVKKQSKSNKFNDFEQNDYDFEELEKTILNQEK